MCSSDLVTAIFTYSLADVMGAYSAIGTGMSIIVLGALLFAVGGAFFIAHSVSRPLEQLAVTARRIATGDYAPAPRVGGEDEIGQLSDALNTMSRSISEREAALTGPIPPSPLAPMSVGVQRSGTLVPKPRSLTSRFWRRA